MSLVGLAIRTCLKRALLDATFAEERVYDSLITPLDELAFEGTKPLIVVSVDDDERRAAKESPRRLDRYLDVVIEMTLAGGIEVVEGEARVLVPHTDAGLELTLDVMAWQVRHALKDPTNPWAELYRTFRGSVRGMVTRRGASTEKGVRFAARQIIITLDPLLDPERGRGAPPEPWDRLLAKMAADDELAAYAPVLAALLSGSTLPPWQVLQAQLGQTRDVMAALGYDALPGAEAEPPATRLTIDTPRGPLVEAAAPP
ncbi:hypothetical protein [uncultured Methylobacterium sp.]|jgi:hypothetical protein|uniref:hypothetical protein n=1 Tax=uncultured Methylobacterium sp. TaxID=157278 RepID=UPI00262BE77B|nr:hypothetical protein [uncultured Methylobacterium sp.]